MSINEQQLQLLIQFIRNRQQAYTNKMKGRDKPWTDDPIIRQYRFCNVYREQDKVTQWIARNWRNDREGELDLWFAMLMARYINEPGTLALIPFPVPYIPKHWFSAVETRKQAGQTVFNAAYIISTGGLSVPKHEYLNTFFTRFWNMRKTIRPQAGDSLASFNERLVAVPGMGSFMSGQVIADLKYAQLTNANDWWSFAVSGPGSRRGLNRIMGNPVKQGWREDVWHSQLSALRRVVNKEIMAHGLQRLHGQDMQNCLCEFDKWSRAYNDEGRPKQKYNGNRE